MKPASIIFMIISVLIIIAGLALCAAGVRSAEEQNYALFATDVAVIDGDVVRTETLEGEISKVKMTLTDVNVTVLPSDTDETYLELRNFRVGSYDAAIQNKVLLIDNSTSIFSIMHIAEGNFSFSGLRHYLTDKKGTNTQKSVLLYLAAGPNFKNFEISVKNGNVDVGSFDKNADFNITVDTGNVRLTGIQTQSVVNVSANRGYIVLDGVDCKSCSVISGEGGCDLLFLDFPSHLEATVQKGDIYTAYLSDVLYGVNFFLNASGRVSYNSDDNGTGKYEKNDFPGGSDQIMTASAGSVFTALKMDDITHMFDRYFPELPDLPAASAEEETAETVPGA